MKNIMKNLLKNKFHIWVCYNKEDYAEAVNNVERSKYTIFYLPTLLRIILFVSIVTIFCISSSSKDKENTQETLELVSLINEEKEKNVALKEKLRETEYDLNNFKDELNNTIDYKNNYGINLKDITCTGGSSKLFTLKTDYTEIPYFPAIKFRGKLVEISNNDNNVCTSPTSSAVTFSKSVSTTTVSKPDDVKNTNTTSAFTSTTATTTSTHTAVDTDNTIFLYYTYTNDGMKREELAMSCSNLSLKVTPDLDENVTIAIVTNNCANKYALSLNDYTVVKNLQFRMVAENTFLTTFNLSLVYNSNSNTLQYELGDGSWAYDSNIAPYSTYEFDTKFISCEEFWEG